MTDSETVAFARRVLEAFNALDGADKDRLWWRTDAEYAPITWLVQCNDLFYWGSADCETITPDNIAELERAVTDCRAVDEAVGELEAVDLFCCRINKTRPQGASYPKDQRFWPLFDACGPERAVGLGNPRPHPAHAVS